MWIKNSSCRHWWEEHRKRVWYKVYFDRTVCRCEPLPLPLSHLVGNKQTESFLQHLLSFNKMFEPRLKRRSASELSLVSRPDRQNWFLRKQSMNNLKGLHWVFIVDTFLMQSLCNVKKWIQLYFKDIPLGASSEKKKPRCAKKLSVLIQRGNSLNSWMSIQLILRSRYFVLLQTVFAMLEKIPEQASVWKRRERK